MTTTVRIGIKEHKALKTYCKEHDLTILEVLDSLINYTIKNDIHPMDYSSETRKNVFSVEERILLEIKKNRDTYVSFQRTFEKQYKKDMFFVKETLIYSFRRLLMASLRASQKEKYLGTILHFFLLTIVEEEIEAYDASQEEIPYIYEKATEKLLREKTYFLADIEKVAKMIIDNYGLFDKKPNQPKQKNK